MRSGGGVLRLTLHQALECGCEGSVLVLHAAAEEENRDDVDWFADVQNDFMGLKLMPKVCERLLQCLSSSTCNLISMFKQQEPAAMFEQQEPAAMFERGARGVVTAVMSH